MSLPLLHLASVDSTQAFLGRHPELGCCAVLADHQSAGRGRGGNRWESSAGGGLWLSARIPRPGIPAGVVLQRAMSAVISAMNPCEAELGLKWPNDLVARKVGRLVKLGGILGEAKGGFLILGLGVNLREAPAMPERAIPPACLADLGVAVPEGLILAAKILEAWEDLEAAPEPPFRWPEPGLDLGWEGGQGRCLGWEEDGRLRVQTHQGIERLSVGDIKALASAQVPGAH